MRIWSGQFIPALALCLGAIGLSAAGCELIASVDRQKIDQGGTGGSGTGGAGGEATGGGQGGMGGGQGGSGGAGGTGGAMCSDPAVDCPPPATECVKATCSGGVCSTMNVPQGTVPTTQAAGDCKQNVCDGNGAVESVDDDLDVEDDMKDCTNDTCSNGTPQHGPATLGDACDDNGGKVCNNASACVECITGVADCTLPDVCQNGNCVTPGCVDAIKDGMETDIDCGGPDCNPCGTNKNCLVGSDCVSTVCTGGKCQAAACNDMVKNGNETDVDCGGTCPGCADNKVCSVAADCLSGVCMGGTCKAATCMDGVKNGTETDIDCGGGCPSTCADGQGCAVGADCASGACSGNACQAPSCTDSVKNGAETGPDCGGPCPMCHLVINEVDYDQQGTDSAEYIEIFNGTGAPVSLANLAVVLVNGGTMPPSVYLTVSLAPGGTLADGQYLVIAPAAMMVPASAIKIAFAGASNNVQNGAPDGIALVDTAAMSVIDALSYEGSVAPITVPGIGMVNLVEGTPLPLVTADDDLPGPRALNRIPNALDHNNAATDWKLSTTLTPGMANVP